ncbi:MAG: hypothetical protein IKV16_06940, partial [Clostridia bacterium]|nr:hypothetical protein [Clostridia bacterium]
MKQIKISDATMKQVCGGFGLSFKEKIEFSKLLDKLGVDVIELEGIDNLRIDSLRIKSIAAAVCDSIVAVPVAMNEKSIEETWSALKQAKWPRLQVAAPTSAVQIEYLFHKKPDAMIKTIAASVAKCASLCADVEFIANDATRSEQDFLTLALKTAIECGATTVTLCDTAGNMFPAELAEFIAKQYEMLPELKSVKLGICCSDELAMAEASAIAAVTSGAEQIRAAAYPIDLASLSNIARILAARSDSIGATSSIRTTQLTRITEQIERICQADKRKASSAS